MLRWSLFAVLVGALSMAAYVIVINSPVLAAKPGALAGMSSAVHADDPSSPEPDASRVHVEVRGAWSWALRDRDSGATIGAGNLRNTTESMIKSWLAVDYLAQQGSAVSAADEALVTRMIRSSDDHAAQALYQRLGGDESVARMITTCGLRDTTIHHYWWSKTTMPATDATLLGECVARAPGVSPRWRDELRDLMSSVDPSNAFGLPEAPALAGRHLAIKNGWTRHDDEWAVNCLGIWDHWVLAVMVHYPDQGDDHRYGASVCKTVAQQLFG